MGLAFQLCPVCIIATITHMQDEGDLQRYVSLPTSQCNNSCDAHRPVPSAKIKSAQDHQSKRQVTEEGSVCSDGITASQSLAERGCPADSDVSSRVPSPLVDQLTDELHFYQLCKVNRSFNLNANGVPLPKLYRMSHHFSTRHRVPVTAVDLTPSDKWRGSAVSF